MDLTVELWNLLVREIVADGPARRGDCEELAANIHVIQERILAQTGVMLESSNARAAMLAGMIAAEAGRMPTGITGAPLVGAAD